MMNNSQGASSFFSGLSTLLGRPHPLLHNLSDTTLLAQATAEAFPGDERFGGAAPRVGRVPRYRGGFLLVYVEEGERDHVPIERRG